MLQIADNIELVHTRMAECEQAPGLNMLQHGKSVHDHYKLLRAEDFDNEKLVKLFNRLPPPEILERYHLYHDCGKPLCLEIIENKRRFPNHAEMSYQQYLAIFPDDLMTATLIKMDMDFHILRGENLVRLCKHPLAPILYFTAWAEINSNSEMFGGKNSDSYKIKRSRLIQAGKKF